MAHTLLSHLGRLGLALVIASLLVFGLMLMARGS